MKRVPPYRHGGGLSLVEWLGKNEVRLFFADGTVIERALPGVRSAKSAHVVDEGMGLGLDDGKGDFSALFLYKPCPGRRVYKMA